VSSSKRITTVNLPSELVEEADEIAESRDRSRSHVVTEALREFCEQSRQEDAPVQSAS